VSDLSKSWESKVQRWQSLLIASCKQCGRADIPLLKPPTRFSEALKTSGPALIASLGQDTLPIAEGLKKLKSENSKLTEVAVFVGPEGGFSPEEISQAMAAGCVPVSLGNYVLRAETACAAACAALAQ